MKSTPFLTSAISALNQLSADFSLHLNTLKESSSRLAKTLSPSVSILIQAHDTRTLSEFANFVQFTAMSMHGYAWIETDASKFRHDTKVSLQLPSHAPNANLSANETAIDTAESVIQPIQTPARIKSPAEPFLKQHFLYSKERWSVLSSPFAHKRAWRQFERRWYQKNVLVYELHPETLPKFVWYVKQNIPSDTHVQFEQFEYQTAENVFERAAL